MKIVHYSQNVLGVGHLFRSLEIDRALAAHQVTLITGGPALDLLLPDNVTHHPLPALGMDSSFSRLHAVDSDRSIEEIKAARLASLAAMMGQVRPDIFLVELFPFGRKKFAFELVPVLAGLVRGDYGRGLAVCSLRDILVEKQDQDGFETRALAHLNTLFQGLLVHADPGLVGLEETFSRTSDIAVPISYTGYVTPVPARTDVIKLRQELGLPREGRILVASAGGGGVGQELLQAVLQACIHLVEERGFPLTLRIFTGPYAPQDQWDRLRSLAGDRPWAAVERFTNRFPEYLAAADLSISLAGYNTSMNLLASGTFGLVLPFAHNREQRLRVSKLAGLGLVQPLDEEHLSPGTLSEQIVQGLQKSRHHKMENKTVNLDGASRSAILLEKLVQTGGF